MAETLSLPSLLLLVIIAFLTLRYFFTRTRSTSSSSTSTAHTRGAGGRPVDLAKVEQVIQMFPQLDRRAIAWDLSRNGGSVGATTERVLVRGSLEGPPPSYQPSNLSPHTPSSSPPHNSPSTSSRTSTAPVPQDLITRYNLTSKLGSSGTPSTREGAEGVSAKKGASSKGWASTKSERAALLAKRREEMVLAARRKMQEKDEAEAKKGRKASETKANADAFAREMGPA